MSLSIGVDVGGTTSTICLGNEKREVLCVSDQFATRSNDGPDATIDDIVTQINKMLDEIGESLESVAKVSLGTPGPSTLDGVLLSTPNLNAELWDNCPIRQKLQDKLQDTIASLEVSYIGDGQAAALGEYAIRSGKVTWSEVDAAPDRNLESLFMVAVGTGFGGGEVRRGQVVRGMEGRAGHAGHILLPAEAFRYEHDRQLKVGNSFCTVESAISLTALTHQLPYRLLLTEWSDHPLHQVSGAPKDKAKRLRELAADGDALAQQLFDDQARALGMALLSINYIGDYDLLVIGGGVCDLSQELRDRYLRTAEQTYRSYALNGFRNFQGVVFSVCGDHASVIGALANAYDD